MCRLPGKHTTEQPISSRNGNIVRTYIYRHVGMKLKEESKGRV